MRIFRIIGRSFTNAFKSIFRNFSLSMASISCTIITLILVSIGILISYNVNNITNQIEKELTVVIFMDKDIALEQAFDYYDAIVQSDISRVDNVNRNPERAKKLMRAYARNLGSQVSNEALKNDMIINDSFSLDTDTVLSSVCTIN